MSINKESHIPYHIQMKKEIEQRIIRGFYDYQLPSEREFMKEYDVSRSTVREAISLLVREGVLVKIQGKGTFVSIKPLHSWLGHLSSTTEVIKGLGKKPEAKLIDFHKIIPPKHIQEITGFKEAYYLKRLRLADKIPIGLEIQYYPLSIGEQLSHYDLDNVTLYDVIQRDIGIPFSEAHQKIGIGKISKEDLSYLEVDESVGILTAERIIRDQAKMIIEYEEAYYRSDMYSFELSLSRKFS